MHVIGAVSVFVDHGDEIGPVTSKLFQIAIDLELLDNKTLLRGCQFLYTVDR